jgi:alpha-aminoadipate carrier protein LysW
LSRSRLPSGILARHRPNCQTERGADAEETMATCPECDAEIEVDEFDVDKGDHLSCPECGSNLEVTGLSPIELDLAPDDDDEEDDEDLEDDSIESEADDGDAEDGEDDEEDKDWEE